MSDPFNLERFVEEQNPVYEQVLSELRAGRKTSHWMWFIFPQLRGLGRSPTADFFGIGSRAEATAYLSHPILGPRLRQCTRLVARIEGRTIDRIFGGPDHLKLKSSMTLFASMTPDNDDFMSVIDKYFQGEFDLRTLDLLRATPPHP